MEFVEIQKSTACRSDFHFTKFHKTHPNQIKKKRGLIVTNLPFRWHETRAIPPGLAFVGPIALTVRLPEANPLKQ